MKFYLDHTEMTHLARTILVNASNAYAPNCFIERQVPIVVSVGEHSSIIVNLRDKFNNIVLFKKCMFFYLSFFLTHTNINSWYGKGALCSIWDIL